MIELIPVKRHFLSVYWPDASVLIEKSLQYSDHKYTLQSIEHSLLKDESQLWLARDEKDRLLCACVTTIVIYPNDKRLSILFCGGEGARDWLCFIQVLKSFALNHGCSAMEIYGRRGWVKLLKRYGFKESGVILTNRFYE